MRHRIHRAALTGVLCWPFGTSVLPEGASE